MPGLGSYTSVAWDRCQQAHCAGWWPRPMPFPVVSRGSSVSRRTRGSSRSSWMVRTAVRRRA